MTRITYALLLVALVIAAEAALVQEMKLLGACIYGLACLTIWWVLRVLWRN